ncbi:efflux RND transporter periplasmic adaptor subunit [Aquincola sp. MAHUQ-54]|uniref:Efflux RND transporter periplasmic adaptor subunit n=1 Tax=Aquincola agrisoli TaxID=3119538 RepID=A0AAW9Q306_9BURK
MNSKLIRHPRTWWLGGVALSALAAAATLTLSPSSDAANPPAAEVPAAVPVSVAAVERRGVVAWDEFSGRLEAVDRVEVRSRVAGAVQAVHFREGSLVRQGDLLVTIDPAPYAAEVDRAEAQVAAAQARVAFTQSEYERAQRLWQEQAIAQRELDERGNAQREAAANLRAAQAALQSARLNLGYTQVKAPVSGRVGRIEVTVGNLISAGAGAPVLTSLVSVNPIYASFDADEQIVTRALAALPQGGREQLQRIPVRMETADGVGVDGKLQLIDNQVDARSGTVRVRAVFDNPQGQLTPGQFARLRMGQARTSEALLLNERAVGTDQSKRFVMVVGEGDKLVWREVTLGATVDGLRIVTSGLQAGERVVVNGLQRVRPGVQVAPKLVPMNAKPEVTAKAGAGSAS